jgi:hypothetical protein
MGHAIEGFLGQQHGNAPAAVLHNGCVKEKPAGTFESLEWSKMSIDARLGGVNFSFRMRHAENSNATWTFE